ncbi:MAG: sporulation integral membrane protein YtvI [Peptococcaceae bacterium]|nr:sporulation integral membrane protein YtvI [Peptococcaceae bacterium]
MSRPVQILVLTAAVVALVYFLVIYFVPEIFVIVSKLFSIAVPFLAAALLALLMEPVVQWIMLRARLSRTLAVSMSMLAFFGTFGLLVVLVTFRLVRELTDLSVSLPRYVKPVEGFITYTIQKSKILYFSLPPEISSRIAENLSVATGTISNMASSLAHFLVNFAAALPGAVLGIIVTVIATFFFSRDRRLIVKFWVEVIPPPWGEKSLEIAREIAQAFLSYIRAQTFLVSLTTVQAIIGLYLIGAKYALTVGFLVGLFDMIPVLGPATILIPWAAWGFIAGNAGLGIKLVVLYVLIWIVRQVLEARVVAANLGLHPLAVLVAMYVGLRLIGVPGLIFGPILLIAVQATYKTLRHGR